jgi:hypothetical protein
MDVACVGDNSGSRWAEDVYAVGAADPIIELIAEHRARPIAPGGGYQA